MIQNAKIVSINTLPEKYMAESEPRGSHKFTVRAHVLSEILRNAKRWVRGYESPSSKAKNFGTLLDCLLLTPEQWPKRYAIIPDDAPRKPSITQREAAKPSPATIAAIKWWDEFNFKSAGCELVDGESNAMVHAAIKRLKEDAGIANLIAQSRKAVMITAEWQDKLTGLTVPLKALIDIEPPEDLPVFGRSLGDLKSTQNASPRSFSQDAQKYLYNLQGAFYLDLYNAATGQERGDFFHVVIESYPPYEYRTPPPLLSQRFLHHGRLQYQAALATYCKALTTGTWPSYDTSKEHPITDCADWFLDMNTVYDEFEEPEEAPPAEPTQDIIP